MDDLMSISGIHSDFYDNEIYIALLKRIVEKRAELRGMGRPDPKYVLLTFEEALMFRVVGLKEVPEKIYGLIVIQQGELVK
jgi:hypothetical protein